MPYTYNTCMGFDGGLEGNLHGLMEQAHTWGTNLCTIPLHNNSLEILHISLSCTVCDKEMWVVVEFTDFFFQRH